MSDGFTADDLIACYRAGVFPMGEAADDPRIFLVDPKERGIIDLETFSPPARLARTVRAGVYEPRFDTVFTQVVEACAARPETWINAPIKALYGELHALGLAHSVECWKDGALVGGLYGVSLGGAFFGESMFSTARDASKVALVHLVERLRSGGFKLLDCQFLTPHLASLGAIEISRVEYRRRLAGALKIEGRF